MNKYKSRDQKKPHILLVEDNSIAATVQKLLIQRMNCEVDIAVSGEEALDLNKKTQYDFILMDLGLPGIDGIQACELIRKHEKDAKIAVVPIVAVTANADPQQRLLCERAGMNDVISKPLTPDKAQQILSILNHNNEEV